MKKLAALAVMLNALLMTACGSGSVIKGQAVQICEQWQPILPSRKDILTDDTARMIAGNNAANQIWCKTQPPAVKIAKAAP